MSGDNRPVETWPSEQAAQQPFLQSPAEGRLVSAAVPAPGLQAGIFLKQGEGQERFFWQGAGNNLLIAGFGVAVQMMAWGAGRFAEIERKGRAIFEQGIFSNLDSPLATPRFFGGFAFRDDFTPDNTWSAFHPAHFFLPHFQLVQAGSASWLTINAILPPDEDPEANLAQLHFALQARYESLLAIPQGGNEAEPRRRTFSKHYPLSYELWAAKIMEAIQQIRQNKLNKVVLSRVCEIRSPERIDAGEALDYLNDHYQDCTRFLFEPKPYHAFYGATPELLARVEGRELQTVALAGSRPRGETMEKDLISTKELLNSAKDLHEHDVVVQAILRRLEPFVEAIDLPEKPSIRSLSYIHHLQTPIHGRLRHAEGILPLVEVLHPTPALGGSPRDQAMAFIQEAEPVPRGWYAGPIGWVDNKMDGEFAVAIRSAVAQKRRVWLYAGAGIVADSNPHNEWEETDLKFQPMFEALGLPDDENF